MPAIDVFRVNHSMAFLLNKKVVEWRRDRGKISATYKARRRARCHSYRRKQHQQSRFIFSLPLRASSRPPGESEGPLLCACIDQRF
jgi:hypothetical protein